MAADLTGGLVVSRVGDGNSALNLSATSLYLDKFSTTGVRDSGQTVALPTVSDVSVNRLVVVGAGSQPMGMLNLSQNKQFLMVGGYDAAVGATGLAASSSSTINRVIGRISLDGYVDTTTKISDGFSGGNGFRMVASNDGYRFWMAGDGAGGTGGVRYADIGSSTSVQVAASPNVTRSVNIHDGQLFMSTNTTGSAGTYATGVGLPTGNGESNTFIAGQTGMDPNDFLFVGDDTLYVADGRNTSSGGVLKFTFNGTSWDFAENINIMNENGSALGLRSITTDGTNLFAVTIENATAGPSRIVSILDGDTNSYEFIATADANTAFRGIRFVGAQPVPEPGTIAAISLGLMGFLRRKKLIRKA